MNPSTRWSLTLPLARIQLVHSGNKVEFSQPGFGRDYVTGAYKLVWLHNIKDKNISSCEVFDFGVKEWRHVTSPPDHRIDHNQEATFANGWLYWFTHEKTKLIAFDLHMEMFQVVPNPIVEASSSSSSISMHMCSLDYDRGLVNISVTNGDGMQHVWRLTNHNTGGALLKTNKIFSFDLNKITSTWFEETHYKSSLLSLTAVSKKGNKLMLAKYGSDKLLLYQPLTPNSIMNRIFSYSPSRPSDSVFLHYFPSLACPL
ncbi:BnaCnng74140D [Brassica napus]|uniref:BnaCnng74140D protein n=1 Tax=Brassica napus TaxID=3708 RepID=A0A078JYG7_BRANA|nr:BnaCnng74140D [Brassica napus]